MNDTVTAAAVQGYMPDALFASVPPPEEDWDSFENALTGLINKHSKENESNTPDFILAQYLRGCLAAFTTAVQQRETWYDRDARPTWGGGAIPHDPNDPPTETSNRRIADTFENTPTFESDAGNAVEVLKRAAQEDSAYAWPWHCNLAMSFIDAGCDHKVAQEGAHRFMQLLFGVETKEPGS